MTIHIRTKIESWWSFIEAAAIKIGDHTFELRGSPLGEGPKYWVNGKEGSEDPKVDSNLKAVESEFEQQFPGFRFLYKHISAKQHKFVIFLNNQGDAISLQTFQDWVSVSVKVKHAAHFVGTKGLMGEYPSGKKLARDGVTVMNDTDSFGKEWQVSDEPTLFYNTGTVVVPEECAMPNPVERTMAKTRRLGESLLTRDAAELACAHAVNTGECVFDVLATNGIGFAGAY